MRGVVDVLHADLAGRLLVTRGVGNLGLNPAQCDRPSVIIITAQIALYPESVYLSTVIKNLETADLLSSMSRSRS